MRTKSAAKIAILTNYVPLLFQNTVDEIERLGYGVDIIEWKNLGMSIDNNSFSLTRRRELITSDLRDYKVLFNHVSSFVYGYYYFALKRLSGLKIVNDWEGVLHSSDKLKSLIKVQASNLKIPATVVLNNSNFDTGIHQAESLIGYPMVMKETMSNNGEKVWLVRDRKSAWILWNDARADDLFLLQEYISGENLRVVVLGDRVLYSVKNILSADDFRANAKFNDGVENYELSSAEAASSIKLAQCLDLDFVGLDLIKTDDGLYFIEANSKPGFRGDSEELKNFGLDVYREFGKYLVELLIESENECNSGNQI